MEPYLRARAHRPLSSWAKGVDRLRHDPPRRKLVSCQQGVFEEKDPALDKAMTSTDAMLGHCKDGNAAHPMENNFTDEFMQLSLEEGSDELCGISESVMRDVQKSAIELLAARAFTVSELTKKLRSKNHPVDVVDTVVAEFKSRFLEQALRQKGVPEAEVDQATRTVFQDGHSNKTAYGISEASMNHLFAQASKQWQRGQSLTLENRRASVVRWLQYRGFNWAVTNAILRKLEAKHPL
ncbi:hypothetical protein PR202_ga18663 [Eleusine coracana subsp. coracana]|uniref:RecX first three-helical domain-containing protein n=1 Tax=Eleusine coracana subsp. coracana TaxID=191504 RepID=A0AAV5CTF9_ELECO|nr:hypothetical protein PR202_ga18663 [Eleusine coracana subsp. coracana]